MIESIPEYLTWLWAIWIAGNLTLFLLGAAFFRPKHTAHYNGFKIIFPASLRERLTLSESMAVYHHEDGHRIYGHVWMNLLRLLLLFPVSAQERLDQELEADDQVGNKLALASAIRKLSTAPQDLYRAERLERGWWQGPQDADNLTPGMGEQSGREQLR